MKANLLYPLSNPENSFRVFHKTHDKQNTPLHYHPNFEMNFVIKGNGKRVVGDNIERFEEGELILLAPNIPHQWENSNNDYGAYSSLVIQWRADFLGNAWQNTPEFRPIRRLLELSNKGIKFDQYIGREIKKNQIDLLELPAFKKLVLFLGLLNDLAEASEFKLLSEQQLSFAEDVPNSRINRVFQFVKENYSDKITLSKMASLLNMSEGAFSRFFSKVMKKPFFSFLNEYRIEVACKMLIESDLQVKEIAYSCGYESVQFFYRQFTKYKNCSPLTYRKYS